MTPGDFSFERDVLTETQCEVHTFDCTENAKEPDEGLVFGWWAKGPPEWRDRLKFHPWCIKGGDSAGPYGSRSLTPGSKPMVFKAYHEIVEELGHKRVDVVKVGGKKSLLSSSCEFT